MSEWFFIWIGDQFAGHYYGQRYQAEMLAGIVAASGALMTDAQNILVTPLGLPVFTTGTTPQFLQQLMPQSEVYPYW